MTAREALAYIRDNTGKYGHVGEKADDAYGQLDAILADVAEGIADGTDLADSDIVEV